MKDRALEHITMPPPIDLHPIGGYMHMVATVHL